MAEWRGTSVEISEPATFLFTDIEDSCGLWERYTSAMESDLETHDAIVRRAVAEAGGTVFRSAGDSVLAKFDEARLALAGAVAAQIELGKRTWSVSEPFRVRMAIHSGVAQARDGDYYGPCLNRCARILGVGHGGQVLLSEYSRKLVGDHVPPGVTITDLGKVRLRGLEDPEVIYQASHESLFADFPAPMGVEQRPHNLPVQLTSFIGRDRDVSQVRNMLRDNRFVTVAGPGGAGKTRLALKVGEQVLADFDDGVWFIELYALGNSDQILAAIASAFSLPERSGSTLEETLIDYLKARNVLFVMDNCEHLIAEVADVIARLGKSCPSIKFLLTSREPLHIYGEAVWRIGPLAVPTAEETEVAEIVRSPSVKLFMERAASVSGLALTKANARDAAAICIRLDGIPLAIEVAASWTKTLAPRQIADRLSERFDLLRRAGRSQISRHDTLNAAIEWSYDLLSADEKRLFRKLSVFSGGWPIEAVERMPGMPPNVLHLLSSLIDKSLVVSEEGLPGELRYRFLESIREFARLKLEETGDMAADCAAHQQFYLQLAEAAGEGLSGDSQAEWMSRIDLERDNFRAAMALGLENGAAAEALRLAVLLRKFWYYRGQFSEGVGWISRLLEEGANVSGQERVAALNALGVLTLPQGLHDKAESFHEQALAEAISVGDIHGASAALHNLGVVASDKSDFDLASRRYSEALELARQLDDPARIAAALMNIGCLAYDKREYAEARPHIEESLAIQRRRKDRWYIAKALAMLGEISIHLGEFEEAKSPLVECLDIFRDLEDKDGASLALIQLGIAEAMTGHEAAAVKVFAIAERTRAGVERGIHPSIQEMLRDSKRALSEKFGWSEFSKLESDVAALDLRDASLLIE
jgi:predicted ATPase/class 3 adenylate cyclase